MKHVFTLSFLFVSLAVFSQERNAPSRETSHNETKVQETAPVGQRTAVSSSQSRSVAATPLPYDVNDKYMGRKEEFLGNLTVSELPADFPPYEKQWSLKEYNQIVEAFYRNHTNIVKKSVREKLGL